MLNQIITLCHLLHDHPERSGAETHTKTLIIDFLRTHASLEINPCGNGFYAAHREAATSKPSIELRTDNNNLPTPNGVAAHLCGHDEHVAARCGGALQLEGNTFGPQQFSPVSAR